MVGPHGLAPGDSDNGERLVAFASAHDMTITNTMFPHKRIHQATWYPPNPKAAPSIKDFILVKGRLSPSVVDARVYRGADIDSDHRLVVCKVKLKWKKKTRREMKRINVEVLKEEEARAQYIMELAECYGRRNILANVEEKWKDFQGAVRTAAEQSLKGRSKVNKVWLQQDTLEFIERKRLAFTFWQEDRLDRARKQEYNILAKEVKRAVRRDKRKWWDDMTTDMEEDMKKHRQGNFFKKQKQFTKSNTRPCTTILDENDQPTCTLGESLARWRRHFDKVLNVSREVAGETLRDLADNSDSPCVEVQRDEVAAALQKLNLGKVAGSDGISAELLKGGGSIITDWLLELIEEVWRSGVVPQDWKDAELVPLHKKGDRMRCDNYRGISLLNVPGKVLSLILLERLKKIIEPQLLEAQCGFREGRGTTDQIWAIRQLVEKSLEHQSELCMCFIDLSKAYDSVNREAMMAVLRKYGVPSHMVSLIEQLYAGTWCQVKMEGEVSERFEVKTGARQGCVLSPILFNCYMDNILREAAESMGGGISISFNTKKGLYLTYRDTVEGSTTVQDALYADDLVLVAEQKQDLQRMLTVVDWVCKKWGMAISVEKSKVLTVGCADVCTAIQLNNQSLEEVESFTYLGSSIDKSGKASTEVDTRIEKGGRAYQMWRKKVFRSANLSKATKMRVFRTLVMSVLLYGAETWTITQKDLRKLRTFHLKCLRDILGVTRWDKIRNENILRSANEVSIEDQLKHLRLQWLGHVIRMDTCRVQRQLLCSRLTGKVRPRGGAPLRWIDLVTKDLKGIGDWREVVHNQPQWREAIRPRPTSS